MFINNGINIHADVDAGSNCPYWNFVKSFGL